MFRRILVPILSCAKSANAEIRANSISLFNIVIERATSGCREVALAELLKLAQAGKAIGPDRKILYSMFVFLGASAQVSSVMVKSVPALLAKETNEAALPIFATSLTPHLAFYLRENIPFPDEVLKLLPKEMQNSKPTVRRAFVALVGETFWALGNLTTASAATFASAVFPAFESSLKYLSANPLNAVAGPVEGYVAVAVLLGPFARSGIYGSLYVLFLSSYSNSTDVMLLLDDTISLNSTVQAILSPSKPSFLVWDKVYQKLTDVEEETWLLRAIESTATFFSSELGKVEQLRFVFQHTLVHIKRRPGAYKHPCFRMHLGSAYLYLATESNVPEFRRHVIASVERLAVLAPETASGVVRAGLTAYLARRRTSTPKNQSTSAEDEKPVVNKQPRLLAFLSASAAFSEGTETTLREQLLSESIVLAHHPVICEYF